MKRLLALLPYLTRHPWRLGIGLLCLGMTSLILAWIPRIVRNAVNVLEDIVSGKAETPQLWHLVWIIVALSLVGGLFRFGMRKLLIDLSRLAERDFRDDTYRHLLNLSPSFYDRTMTGDIVTRLSSDMDAVRMVMGPALMYLGQTAITVPVVLGLMFMIDMPLAAVSLAPLVFVPMVTQFFANEMHVRSRAMQDQMSTLSTMVQETLSGQRVVKSFNQEGAQQARFDKINEEYVKRGLKFASIFSAFFPMLHSVFSIGLLVTVWVGGYRVIGGAIGYGDLTAIFLWIFILYWPLISLGWVMSLLQRGTASMERIQELLAEQSDVQDAENALSAEQVGPLKGEIEFRNLTFAYPRSNTPALEEVNLTIPAGKTLGIVGLTGSGKSTLAAAIARFYPVPDGQLFIDGHDINTLTLSQLRDHIGYVAQETFLFSESIADNIRYGRPEATHSEVEVAAHLSQLEDQILGFSDKWDTMLGERGINLSGGQRQRAAIARAAILDPAILILDDCLSAVDTDTEERILRGLRTMMKDRTTLIIAHRISTVMHADAIIVLDDGRIIERGNHRELIALDGLYADLHRRQQLEAELERVD